MKLFSKIAFLSPILFAGFALQGAAVAKAKKVKTELLKARIEYAKSLCVRAALSGKDPETIAIADMVGAVQAQDYPQMIQLMQNYELLAGRDQKKSIIEQTGTTILHTLAVFGYQDAVRCMVDNGFDPRFLNGNNLTAALIANTLGHNELSTYLKQKEAEFNEKDKLAKEKEVKKGAAAASAFEMELFEQEQTTAHRRAQRADKRERQSQKNSVSPRKSPRSLLSQEEEIKIAHDGVAEYAHNTTASIQSRLVENSVNERQKKNHRTSVRQKFLAIKDAYINSLRSQYVPEEVEISQQAREYFERLRLDEERETEQRARLDAEYLVTVHEIIDFNTAQGLPATRAEYEEMQVTRRPARQKKQARYDYRAHLKGYAKMAAIRPPNKR